MKKLETIKKKNLQIGNKAHDKYLNKGNRQDAKIAIQAYRNALYACKLLIIK